MSDEYTAFIRSSFVSINPPCPFVTITPRKMKYIHEGSIAQVVEQFCQNLYYILYTTALVFAIYTYKKVETLLG